MNLWDTIITAFFSTTIPLGVGWAARTIVRGVKRSRDGIAPRETVRRLDIVRERDLATLNWHIAENAYWVLRRWILRHGADPAELPTEPEFVSIT